MQCRGIRNLFALHSTEYDGASDLLASFAQ